MASCSLICAWRAARCTASSGSTSSGSSTRLRSSATTASGARPMSTLSVADWRMRSPAIASLMRAPELIETAIATAPVLIAKKTAPPASTATSCSTPKSSLSAPSRRAGGVPTPAPTTASTYCDTLNATNTATACADRRSELNRAERLCEDRGRGAERQQDRERERRRGRHLALSRAEPDRQQLPHQHRRHEQCEAQIGVLRRSRATAAPASRAPRLPAVTIAAT